MTVLPQAGAPHRERVRFDASRLRPGELIAGGGAAVLLMAMFALKWYVLVGQPARRARLLSLPTTVDGWHGLTELRWLILATVLAATSLFVSQAARRSPGVPTGLSHIVTALGFLTTLALVYRLINRPPSDAIVGIDAGAVIGLASAIAILCGGFLSLRREGVLGRDAPAVIKIALPQKADLSHPVSR